MGAFQIALMVEVVATAVALAALAKKRRKLGDAMIYAGVAAALVIVTGVVGWFAGGSDRDTTSSALLLTLFGAPVPFVAAGIAHLAATQTDATVPKSGSSAVTGAGIGFALGTLLVWGGCESFGNPEPSRISWMLISGVFVAIPGLLVGWIAGNQKGAATAPATPAAQSATNPQDRLKQLTALREQGLVSDAEYEAKKAEILKAL